MAAGVEDALCDSLERVRGLVNVPDDAQPITQKIVLHAARPRGSNFPTPAGVAGADAMLRLLARARTMDVAICLLSGGGSALMPAPADGISLNDKLAITSLLHASGADIREMNCVRKHLSRVKGGRLAAAFRGRALITLAISDVPDDAVDVIASGPTAADSSTFSDALEVMNKYGLTSRAPATVVQALEAGHRGERPETLKQLPRNVIEPIILANQDTAWFGANEAARDRGWRVSNLSSHFRGEAREVAALFASIARGPHLRPKCFLFSGETTVTLGPDPGKGGRSQEFVLAMLCELGTAGMHGVTILCAGTDGEDGPTDAAGAVATLETLQRAEALGIRPRDFLERHDAYRFFEAAGGLLKTGLTGTNVMDLGMVLLE